MRAVVNAVKFGNRMKEGAGASYPGSKDSREIANNVLKARENQPLDTREDAMLALANFATEPSNKEPMVRSTHTNTLKTRALPLLADHNFSLARFARDAVGRRRGRARGTLRRRGHLAAHQDARARDPRDGQPRRYVCKPQADGA